ncbi:MAG: hypothetical protein M0T74_13775 [Desulfitobacterium hafniense]|nr:hypothetical protein [Desulfitobacterium hafniense]
MRQRWVMFSKVSKRVTIAQLQIEYDCQRWLDASREALSALGDEFRKAAEKMYEVFVGQFTDQEPTGLSVELLEQIKAVQINAEIEKEWTERLRLLSKHFTQKLRNNYRKLHALPLKHRPRCRWRQRESRRSLEGLSPDITIIDECVEEDRG